MDLSNDEKIAHLLRRFGLGAGAAEMERYRPLGVEGTIDRLLDYEKVPDNFPVSPWEWHTDTAGVVRMGAGNTRAWWLMRMSATNRPLEDKLAVFWHDHFAVSATSVSSMEIQDYMDRIRAHSAGPFRDLLGAMTYSPAMVRWLDALGSLPAKPNENFARELVELFTIGIGNYTEKDVHELARCFVGFGVAAAIPPGVKAEDYYRKAALEGLPMVSITLAPAFQEKGTTTIRGRKVALNPDAVLDDLAGDPLTARRVVKKLWTFFGSEIPLPEADVDRLARAYTRGGMQPRAALREMTRLAAFWDPRTVRALPKSPLDFAIPLYRQLNVANRYLAKRPANASPVTSIRAAGPPYYGLAQSMADQGLSLLFPADVSGWKWGSAWLTSGAMIARRKLVAQIFSSGWADEYLQELIRDGRSASDSEVVRRVAADLDVPLDEGQQGALEAALKGKGGARSALADLKTARRAMADLVTLMVSAPSFHLA